MTNFDYDKRLANLKNRRQETIFYKSDSDFEVFQPITESYELLDLPKSFKYAVGAMKEVDKTYTMNTFKTGDRIKNQLINLTKEGYELSFRYQGSVSNNTHIKSHSDIDLLVITEEFYSLESPQIPSNPYNGNPENELLKLRIDAIDLLTKAFPAVKVDSTGAKSISLEGGSLSRKVDVVPSNWFDSNKYAQTKNEIYRGIMVLDCKQMKRITNTPFFHNYLLDQKNISTNDKYKEVVRLLKTLKADSVKGINLSSYDIAAIPYHLEDFVYISSTDTLSLLDNVLTYLLRLCDDENKRNGLYVPDGSRKIFERAKLVDLQAITIELGHLLIDIRKELQKQNIYN